MEGLHEGHINPFFLGGHRAGLGSLEKEDQVGRHADDGFAEECNQSQRPINNPFQCHRMPFLHMLQERELFLEVESVKTTQTDTGSFQLLLRLQEEQLHHHRQQRRLAQPLPLPPSSLELDSCITHSSEPAADVPLEECKVEEKDKRKRKRCRTSKKAEEAESQRMSHIAVERNRRRLMNDHLAALRALMPSSYIQRGDQASIVGGAIDFVKELEQHLQSLQAEKQMRTTRSGVNGSDSENKGPFEGFFTSPQYTMPKAPATCSPSSSSSSGLMEDDVDGHGGAAVADIEVMVVQTHINLRVLTRKRPGQLLTAIAGMEDLGLTVLHLNITSLRDSVLYSLNLKTEEECRLGSADEIASAVHQIFAYINQHPHLMPTNAAGPLTDMDSKQEHSL